MNKKMRELLAKIEQKRQAAKGYMDGETKDMAKAKAVLDEVDTLVEEFEIEKRLFEAEKAETQPTAQQVDDVEKAKNEKIDGFKLMAKIAKKKALSEGEKALITGGSDGEDYLLPEDVKLAINELRRQYISAKDLVNVVSTTALTGTANYETGTPAGLTALVDGAAIDETNQPSFSQVSWAIEFFAKLIPVSNILAGAERAGLMGYLNRWFVKNAIITENNAIFAALKSGKTATATAGWEALKLAINTNLDPACLIDGVIVTNQTGFSILDAEKFDDGRPVLQENPADPTKKMFQGLPIHVFSDAQLPQETGDVPPMFVGSLKAGCEFEDYEQLQFATSADFYFGKNQTAVRVIEGFDTFQTDSDAYLFLTFAPTPAV